MFSLRLIVWLPAVLVAFGGAAVVSHKAAKDPEPVERLRQLETVAPMREPVRTVRVEVLATVEALEKTDLCARVAGVVDAVPPEVDIGRKVRAGQALIRLHVPDLDALRRQKVLQVDLARKQEVQARRAWSISCHELREAEEQERRSAAEHAGSTAQQHRIGGLVRRGAQQPEREEESRNQLEVAAAAWQTARAQIASRQAQLRARAAAIKVARSQVEVAQAELRSVAVQLAYATVTAPFDGVITKRWVDQGAMINNPSTPLLTVMRTDTVRVVLDIAEPDVLLLRAGGPVPGPGSDGNRVELDMPSLRPVVPGGRFTGHVTYLAAALDPRTHTMRAEVHLPNQQGHLRPGMHGTATVLLAEHRHVVTVPATAVVKRGGHHEVFLVIPATHAWPRGVVTSRRVQVIHDNGLRVEVHGLTGHEQVVAKGNAGTMREGDTVLAVPAGARE
ncbi:MAG TPA: efflux RND transporter periplasmic adaptor subunit [Gemmataceae bacterium]|nr:efflux RND transporter periplasmic adaptor subunit [Gemmataceae bacterium]